MSQPQTAFRATSTSTRHRSRRSCPSISSGRSCPTTRSPEASRRRCRSSPPGTRPAASTGTRLTACRALDSPSPEREEQPVDGDAGLDIDYDTELAKIQATANGKAPPPAAEVEVAGKVIASSRTVELLGRRFRIADKIGLMPLLKFSAFADMDVQDGRALGALYAMLRDCIHPGHPGCGECQFCAPERCGECPSCQAVTA